MLEDSLAGGFRVLVLTNAMKPMQRLLSSLFRLNEHFPRHLIIRVSLDHYRVEQHERLRSPRTWQPTIEGLTLLAWGGLEIAVAGRTVWGETEDRLRAGYGALFAKLRLPIDANDPSHLVLFPELEPQEDVPEIAESCWHKIRRNPNEMMPARAWW
jgi:hypothetical protein